PESASAGILACGVQGRSNLEALACVFPLRSVKAYDLHRDVAERFAAEMGAKLGLTIDVVANPRGAVDGLDLVVTSGPILKHPTPTIDAGWLAPGAFASPVDFDSYWTGGALREIDVLATDDGRQMEYYREAGYFRDTPAPHADLGELVTGRKPGRRDARQRTMSINLGIALEDMATAVAILERARERGLGRVLPL
ncbi:MAG TPA: hypothetical protein VML54_15705, partial [Candidatus Limnocylindrales bacterium]|nr:hypothetical protein [Candidatus Limnocylindrales bacterium]